MDPALPAATAAAVLHPWTPGPGTARNPEDGGVRTPESALAEAVALAGAIHLNVTVQACLRLTRPSPATLLGGGAVESLKAQFEAAGVGVVIINHPLSPVQQRNLERAWERKVIDRTGLILDIFGARARTREGQLQVELAALEFQRSRLVRSWTHLERQRGGYGFLGGPGESQLEVDRRLIGDRITRIRKDLEKVRQTRHLHRSARQRNETPLVALVGYTNAGKSTLFNALTAANVVAEDMLFATLDPTLRRPASVWTLAVNPGWMKPVARASGGSRTTTPKAAWQLHSSKSPWCPSWSRRRSTMWPQVWSGSNS